MSLKSDIEEAKKEVQEIKEQSLAMELLQDYKKINKRQFITIILILCLWFATGCYLVYVLNDIGIIEETTQEVTQENDNGNNNFIGNDGDIIYGETND